MLLVAIVLFAFLRGKSQVLAGIAAAVVICIGLVPLIGTAYAKSQNIYRVRLVVIRPDQSLADIAQVKTSNSGDLKMADGWVAARYSAANAPCRREGNFPC
jgi:hypothetical protein